jgi:hypothetical protein
MKFPRVCPLIWVRNQELALSHWGTALCKWIPASPHEGTRAKTPALAAYAVTKLTFSPKFHGRFVPDVWESTVIYDYHGTGVLLDHICCTAIEVQRFSLHMLQHSLLSCLLHAANTHNILHSLQTPLAQSETIGTGARATEAIIMGY